MTLLQAFKMTCAEATRLHELKREGRLSFMQRFGLWWHTSIVCSLCRLFFKQVAQLERAAAQLAERPALMDESKKAEMAAKIADELKQ